jgi:hypothetical protein
MIVREFYRVREDGVTLYRTYSDANLMIRKVGTEEVYSEAIDVESAPYTYEETEEKIEREHIENEDCLTTNTKEVDYVEYTE